jgi:cyclopropane-fatty-acyl-phospholipid synthase
MLEGLHAGSLDITLPDGSRRHFSGKAPGPAAAIRIVDWSMCGAVLRAGDIGFAESWIDGRWNTDDLHSVLLVAALNKRVLDAAIYGRWWGTLAARLRHLLNRNSRRGSRRNIAAHYDLGNDFYRLWLDETMLYSAALFEGDPDRSLADAQRAKLARVLTMMSPQPGQRVLEIGCGWGGFAELAAREGLHVTGLTLSERQLEWALDRVRAAGVADRVDLKLLDYRDVSGTFDRIVSIEMFEAVGRQYWATYFRRVRELLASGGIACIQTITIDDREFDRYVLGTDFIQQYIFPGGMLPSPSAFRTLAAEAGLVVEDAQPFGLDYARTLHAWRIAFDRVTPELDALGYDEPFRRTWRFYLAYCEAGFRAGLTDVWQYRLRKPAGA